jgi:hypothetical protein
MNKKLIIILSVLTLGLVWWWYRNKKPIQAVLPSGKGEYSETPFQYEGGALSDPEASTETPTPDADVIDTYAAANSYNLADPAAYAEYLREQLAVQAATVAEYKEAFGENSIVYIQAAWELKSTTVMYDAFIAHGIHAYTPSYDPAMVAALKEWNDWKAANPKPTTVTTSGTSGTGTQTSAAAKVAAPVVQEATYAVGTVLKPLSLENTPVSAGGANTQIQAYKNGKYWWEPGYEA